MRVELVADIGVELVLSTNNQFIFLEARVFLQLRGDRPSLFMTVPNRHNEALHRSFLRRDVERIEAVDKSD
jgi:hypothetical protein